MYRRERDCFNADHLRILLAVSSKLGLAIENALKYQQAESSATTDYLTGLPNARSLFLHLSQELSRCQRKGGSTAVMVCDLDGFKKVNDRFGHLEGDKVLRELGAKLKEACRGYDYVARMGGDEFVLVVPDLAPDSALIKARALHDLAVSTGLNICGENLLGLSVGTAFCPEDGLDAEQLLAEADRRMYSVKQIHRDQMNQDHAEPFEFSPPPPEPETQDV
jgi:diguanylate cyclase (GGDEF)-like protein